MSLRNDPAVREWELQLDEDEWRGLDVAVETVRRHFPSIDVYRALLAGYRKSISFGRYEPGKRKGRPLLSVRLFAESGRSYISVRSDWNELKEAIEKASGKRWDVVRMDGITLRELAAGSSRLDELCRMLQELDSNLLAKVAAGAGLEPSACPVRERGYTELSEKEREEELVEDLEQLVTERSQLVLARLGQGAFRDKVLKKWGGRCAVTGVGQADVLRASHIKPWRECDPDDGRERLDENNGLALCGTYDALFDRGLISFDDDGRMLVSRQLGDKELRARLGLGTASKREETHPALRLLQPLNATQKSYMAYHREHLFRR